jgi:hypothetical protein
MTDIVKALGLDGKAAVIVHHDDLGVTHAQNAAHRGLEHFPTGSLIVPAGWACEWAGEPGLDLGVHITLTSEWPQAPRWRPLTGGKSLRDPHGFFWRTAEQAWAAVRADEAEAEMRAQIETAMAWGIDVTHIDTHMGTVLRPDLAEIYHHLALEYRVPAFLPTVTTLDQYTFPTAFRDTLKAMIATSPLPQMGAFSAYQGPLDGHRPWLLRTLRELQPGLWHFIHHAALPTPEGQMLPDWQTRRADYEALADPAARATFDGDVVLLTYRQLRDALREAGVFQATQQETRFLEETGFLVSHL